jgi:A/G-specific adenine glycosylase
VTADLRAFRHTLSHFHLDIEPIETTVLSGTLGVMERSCLWYNPSIPEQLGLAAPVVEILSRTFQNKGHADE